MTTQKHVDKPRSASATEGMDGATEIVPAVPGCEVIEYDELTGQREWSDSLFVQDFTDSMLATKPAPLDAV
jgi:hypothetical protein